MSADRPGAAWKSANQGTAKRYDWLAPAENLRPGARPNLCIFRCAPRSEWPLDVAILEHHPNSTQAFFPMNATRYVVLVAEPRPGSPDLATLRAFLAMGNQGCAYKPGTWHHPLIALDRETDFGCLVFEDESEGDGALVEFAPGERVRVELA